MTVLIVAVALPSASFFQERSDETIHRAARRKSDRHCEEHRDEAIQLSFWLAHKSWIASLRSQ
jgi:hypothetical protein